MLRKILLVFNLCLFFWPWIALWCIHNNERLWPFAILAVIVLIRVILLFAVPVNRSEELDKAVAKLDEKLLLPEDELSQEERLSIEKSKQLMISGVNFKKIIPRIVAVLAVVAVVVMSLLFLLVEKDKVIFYYPVVISLLFFCGFFTSLIYPPSVITLMALATLKPIDEREVLYTTRLTKIWCGYFVINAAISYSTIYFENEEYWAIYSGGISYVIMGSLLIGEMVFRPYLRKLIT